ncbi:MAG: glycosyltransferase, partial [Candidatus Microthrix parvicella]
MTMAEPGRTSGPSKSTVPELTVPELSVVAPVFDEADTIEEFHRRLSGALEGINGLDPGRCEMVYIDDGSTDSSGALLAAIAADDPRVTVVTFSRNFGHQVAITAGLD